MVNSPISIPLALSQSRKPSDLVKTQALAADALRIERHINSQMKTEFIREFSFGALAADLSMDQERVCSLLSKLAAQENAITVCNPQNRGRPPVTKGVTGRVSSRSAWTEPSSLTADATV